MNSMYSSHIEDKEPEELVLFQVSQIPYHNTHRLAAYP